MFAVSVLMKRRVSEQMESCKMSHENISVGSTCERVEEPVDRTGSPAMSLSECNFPPSQDSEGSILDSNDISRGSSQEAVSKSGSEYAKSITMQCNECKKKARNSQWSQLSLKSFFKKSTNIENAVNDYCTGNSNNQAETSQPDPHVLETPSLLDHNGSPKQSELDNACDQDLTKPNDSSTKKEKSDMASLEWQRIQQLMQNSIPLCKGHKELCVARVVKKQGPNSGRRFYVCARAEVISYVFIEWFWVLCF